MPTSTMTVDVDDPLRADVLAFLEEHLADMFATSPAESVHALDPEALADPAVTFWTARDATGALLGCVAVKQLSPTDGELKSMRTAAPARGRGIGATLLARAVSEASTRGYRTLHLETGTQEYFAAARRLYGRAGFVPCEPFAEYTHDPHSAYFRLDLPAAPGT